jgi:hypothetical protein
VLFVIPSARVDTFSADFTGTFKKHWVSQETSENFSRKFKEFNL